MKNKSKVLYKQEYRAFRAARMHDGVHDVPFWGTVDQVACCYFCNKDNNCQPCCNLCVRFVCRPIRQGCEVPARGAGQCFKHNNEAKASKKENARTTLRTTLQSQAQSPRTNF